MNIHCFKCEKEFVPSELNTGIIGPYVKITCPYCSDVFEGKFLTFVDQQAGGHRPHSHQDAAGMQRLAQFIELNSSDYYKKRGLRHGKKKVRNVRD